MVRGLQGGADGVVDNHHVMATLKHLAGHGAPEGGLNRSSSHVGPHELRETHLLPFAMIIRNAHPGAIMPCYNDVDGIPSHANKDLLLGYVRGELGFKGLFVSDYNGVSQLYTSHHLVGTAAEAARLALESGVQMELPIPETFFELEPLMANDHALALLVDDAVRAVLKVKFQMGLFEEKPLDVTVPIKLAHAESSRALALQAARESIVLLRNEGNLLPLSASNYKRIAVIGPNADIARLGGYSGMPLHSVSLLEGLRERLKGQVEVVHAEGCKITDQDAREAMANWRKVVDVKLADPELDRRLINEAVALAEKSDLVILALGEDEVVCRESWAKNKLGDRASLDLIGAQTELANRILALGKPVVLYLSNGRPISLGSLGDRIPAILEGWYAGQETGRAAAEILFGDVCPSGKLTISFPLDAGHIPAQYRRKPYSAAYTYLLSTHEPKYPFGFGLSYTRFEYTAPRVDRPWIGAEGKVTVSVDVTNSGAREGDEVVQLYLQDEVASVTRPVMELRGFRRVSLKPGERRTVSFELGADELAMYNRQLRRVVEPGWFCAMVGGSSAQTQRVRFEVR
jgi:beta-glucosidase